MFWRTLIRRADAQANTPPKRLSTTAIVSLDPSRAAWPKLSRPATKRWGKPNGYVLGQEAGGAFIGGLRYGEGIMYTRNAGDLRVFWQGPSLGFDAGADGDRTMMLVYNLPATNAIFRRYGGVDGSAYLVGGFGMTALVNDNVFVVPIRSGLGARLGFNVSYLKFTESSTWNPF